MPVTTTSLDAYSPGWSVSAVGPQGMPIAVSGVGDNAILTLTPSFEDGTPALYQFTDGRGQKPRQSFICNRYRCSGRVADWLGSLGYSSFLKGGFHNSLATLPATRKMHAAWSSDWMMKPRRS